MTTKSIFYDCFAEMKQIKKVLGLKYEPILFSNRDAAFRYEKNTYKSSCVFLGDNERFWVIAMCDFSKVTNAGYEHAI